MSDSQPASANRAVFLSYASQDAEAVERIAVALRARGVEVWFDKNELVGGDAWDTKIKRQIQSCALFVPVVSASTQQREEGYFRREWNLAANRTLDMAHDKAFLLPVVIDTTSDSAAKVPEKFREVQWTRLPGGDATPAFVARVQKLLSATNAPLPATTPPNPASMATVTAAKSGLPPWVTIALGVAVLALVAYVVLRPAAKETIGPAEAAVGETKPASVASPTPPPGPAAFDAKSIAVLPFVNMSGDKDSEYFSDGLTEEILNALARNPALRVAARTSSFAFKGKSTAMDEIGRALHAAGGSGAPEFGSGDSRRPIRAARRT